MIQTGNKNFWYAQCIGWAAIALSNLTVQYIGGVPPKLLLINSLLPFLAGFFVTTIFRHAIKKYSWKKLNFKQLIGLILISSLIQTTALLVIIILSVKIFFGINMMALAPLLSNFFIFGFILLTWNLIYFLIHFFNNWHYSEVEKWQLLSEMKDAQLVSLKAQINPHFVFNTINNIRTLILEDTEKARDMLMNFSDMLRYSLKHSGNAKVLLKEEIEVVEEYLELLSIQFEEKLKYNIQVEPELLDQEVPPMVIQMLVENAVKHGISQQVNGGHIDIIIFKRDNSFIIEVKNNGTLKTKASLGERIGIGIQNIKDRLNLLYDKKASLSISENQNWVTASIIIPLH